MTIEHRRYAPELTRAAGGDGRTVEGIAVPYGQPQRIYEGLTEQFARGAFAHQVAAMRRVQVAREHYVHGGVLIGRIHEAREDARGLWVSMRVSATPAGDETLTLIEDGVLSELSIGFRAKRDRTLPDGTIERVKADLTEVSVVRAGAYGQKAKVLATRAAEDDDEDERDQDARPNLAAAAAALAAVPLLDRYHLATSLSAG